MGPDEDIWFVGEFHGDGGVQLVRALRQLPSASTRERFTQLVLVRWPYEVRDGASMPDPDTFGRMTDFSERLCQAVEPTGIGVEAASLTGRGVREWRFFAADTGTFVSALNQALAGLEVLPIELQGFLDPDWAALEELLPR